MSRLRCAALCLLCFASQSHAADDPLQQLQAKLQNVIEKAEPAVVCLLVSRSTAYREYDRNVASRAPGQLGDFSWDHLPVNLDDNKRLALHQKLDLSHPRHVPESYGSGVVLDADGLILTTAHVVRDATKIYVRFPGGKGSYANVHALDPRSDLAVLKPIKSVGNLRPIKLGNADNVKKGQFIVTLSNPYAAGHLDGSPSASTGIVSNLRRRMPGYRSEAERNKLMLHHFGTLIQTDVRINAGCSGGALLNLDGEMIGIVTSQAALTGIDTPGGFALPINSGLRRIIDVLKLGREVEYAFLGVQFDRRPQAHVRITSAIPNGPAAQGGLKNGDYIRSVGGMRVKSNDDLFLALGLHLVGEMIVIERSDDPDGPWQKATVTLGKFYLPRKIIASQRSAALGGLRVDYPTTLVQGYWDASASIPNAVRVREVVENSPAHKAKLQVGAVITKVNGAQVTTPDEFERAVKNAGKTVTLTVENDSGGERTVELSLSD